MAMSQICVGKEAALLWERIYPRISRLKPLPQEAFERAALATVNRYIAFLWCRIRYLFWGRSRIAPRSAAYPGYEADAANPRIVAPKSGAL
jgi:hypothetical protein